MHESSDDLNNSELDCFSASKNKSSAKKLLLRNAANKKKKYFVYKLPNLSYVNFINYIHVSDKVYEI